MADGIFLGGLQTGIKQGREGARASRSLDITEKTSQENIRLRSQGLQLQERQIKNAEQRDLAARSDKAIADTMSIITEVIEAGKGAGRDSEMISKSIAPLLEDVTGIAERAGRDPNRFTAQVQALISGPSPEEAAAGSGRAAATEITSQAQALEAGGIPPASAQATAGIKQPAQPKAIQLRTFQMPDGNFLSVRADDATQINATLEAGGVETPRRVDAATVAGLDPLTASTRQEVAKTRADIGDLAGNLEELGVALKAFEKTPEAGGISGTVIEKAGGLLQQLPGGVGEKILEAAGVDPAKVTKVRTQFRTLTAQMLTTITKETSRFSDAEREIAQETLKTLDITASEPQIRAALETATDLQERAMVRLVDKLRIQGKITDEELGTAKGIDNLEVILKKNGMTQDAALRAVIDLRARLGITGLN